MGSGDDPNNMGGNGDALDAELEEWFAREGLMRWAVVGDVDGEVVEVRRAPLVWLGARDEDFVAVPHPARQGYPGKPLREMTMEDFNVFMYRWFEAVVSAGMVRCAQCGRVVLSGDDLPDPETWDAIFIEKEIVAWMLVHFDCKKALPKKLKGMHPFELSPGAPPHVDLAHLQPRDTLPAGASAEADQGGPGVNGAKER